MTFHQPPVLVLLLVLPFVLSRRRAERDAAAIVFAPLQYVRPPARRRHSWTAVLALDLTLFATLVVALAGPHRVETVERVGEPGLDLTLVLDVSASMQAADFPPTRLEVLKELAAELVRHGPGNRIAVCAFAKHVFTQSPLTRDHRLVADLIGELSYDSIDHGRSGGTSIGDALLAATDALARARIDGRAQAVVLITDGESSSGIDPLLAARLLREEGIRLTVVGVGGADPVAVTVRGKPFITESGGVLMTALDDESLVSLADRAGGSYVRASSADVLASVFEDLAHLERTPLEIETIRVEQPYAPLLALLLFGLFALRVGLEGGLLRSPLA